MKTASTAISPKTRSTRNSIVESAQRLFLKHGISRVTVKEISMEAEVSKMTFYRIFANKEQVAAEVIQSIADKNLAEYKEIMSRPIDFIKKIQELILSKRKSNKAFSEELIKDIYKLKNSPLTQLIAKLGMHSKTIFMEDLEKAQRNGEIRSDIKLPLILYTINDMEQKMKDERFLALFEDFREASDQLMSQFFYGIMPVKSTGQQPK